MLVGDPTGFLRPAERVAASRRLRRGAAAGPQRDLEMLFRD